VTGPQEQVAGTASEKLIAAITKSPATTLTAGATVVWALTYVIRAIRPEVPIGGAADSIMTTIVAWYFSDKTKGKS